MAHKPINAASTEHNLPSREKLNRKGQPTGKIQVQCPCCDAWRPSICITQTEDGSWLGDCCISKKRREGEIVVTKYIEE